MLLVLFLFALTLLFSPETVDFLAFRSVLVAINNAEVAAEHCW